MSSEQAAFDRLHPAVQHHIVNTLGWGDLRPTQQAAIAPILDGRHCILLAPTAGGKTEAAIFPVLSRMLTEDWRGLSVLYVCPIRALLNNLEPRLSFYLGLTGRRVGLWHGDVSDSVKRRMIEDPPDLLLTTPESIEGMLISASGSKRDLLRNVRIVVIDELHAFCGDDRGWHVRCVIRRLRKLVKRVIQVIALTATVGNPQELIEWMVAGEPADVVGNGNSGTEADIVIDYVGSLENAAIVISRLHVGSKRLVFCDSRAKTEELAAALRGLDVRTYISHSSISTDERRQAEKAFAEEPNCVIVATSTLELGIDVGDLDNVIQIDAPTSVASFLQRMGRTGRRSGTQRNCTFLATEDEGLLIGCAIVRMWREAYIEPISPPTKPWHLIAQQAMALILQYRGLSRHELASTLADMFDVFSIDDVNIVVSTMLERDILWEDANDVGVIGLGRVGEDEYGRRHFESIISTFNSPLLLSVVYGQREIGFVDPIVIQNAADKIPTLTLGGRYWCVVSTDWRSRKVYVESSENKGKASWLGSSRALPFALCQTIKRILIDQSTTTTLSFRAVARLNYLSGMFSGLEEGNTTSEHIVCNGKAEWRWWTFAGGAANFWLAELQIDAGVNVTSYDNFSLRLDKPPKVINLPIENRVLSPVGMRKISQLIRELKFSNCLPGDVAIDLLASRLIDKINAESLMY